MRKQKIEKFFHLKGKTLVIIDWANVHGWFEKLNWEINPRKLFKYLKSYKEIKEIRFYFGVEKGNQKSENFQKTIKNIGYTLVSKEMKWVPVSLDKSHFKRFILKLNKISKGLEKTNHGMADEIKLALKTPILRRKCDFDCEIAIDMMRSLDSVDGVILFSGDGDYAVLISEVIKKGKQAIVVFAPGSKGKEYKDSKRGLFLCSAQRLGKYLRK